MSLQEKLALLTVFISIVVVFVAAAWGFLREIVELFGVLEREQKRFLIWLRRSAIILAIFGIWCFAYSYFIEPYWLEVRKIEICSNKIPPGSKPIRVIHISDIHSDEFPRLETKLPEVIANENPDLIVYTGDSINSLEGLPVFRECLTRIAQIAPTFVVRGNWDVWYWEKQNLFGEINVRQLNGNSERIEVRGIPIRLTGVFVESEGRIKAGFKDIPKNEFSIFLAHYPDLIEEVAQLEPDLYCAGHTHGGQIAMPFYGALVTFSKFGKKYEGGTYREGKTTLNVSRGIGMEGGNTPRVRFGARPEVTVIDLIPN